MRTKNQMSKMKNIVHENQNRIISKFFFDSNVWPRKLRILDFHQNFLFKDYDRIKRICVRKKEKKKWNHRIRRDRMCHFCSVVVHFFSHGFEIKSTKTQTHGERKITVPMHYYPLAENSNSYWYWFEPVWPSKSMLDCKKGLLAFIRYLWAHSIMN